MLRQLLGQWGRYSTDLGLVWGFAVHWQLRRLSWRNGLDHVFTARHGISSVRSTDTT